MFDWQEEGCTGRADGKGPGATCTGARAAPTVPGLAGHRKPSRGILNCQKPERVITSPWSRAPPSGSVQVLRCVVEL